MVLQRRRGAHGVECAMAMPRVDEEGEIDETDSIGIEGNNGGRIAENPSEIILFWKALVCGNGGGEWRREDEEKVRGRGADRWGQVVVRERKGKRERAGGWGPRGSERRKAHGSGP